MSTEIHASAFRTSRPTLTNVRIQQAESSPNGWRPLLPSSSSPARDGRTPQPTTSASSFDLPLLSYLLICLVSDFSFSNMRSLYFCPLFPISPSLLLLSLFITISNPSGGRRFGRPGQRVHALLWTSKCLAFGRDFYSNWIGFGLLSQYSLSDIHICSPCSLSVDADRKCREIVVYQSS